MRARRAGRGPTVGQGFARCPSLTSALPDDFSRLGGACERLAVLALAGHDPEPLARLDPSAGADIREQPPRVTLGMP